MSQKNYRGNHFTIMESKVWFITGASQGLGLATVIAVLEKGCKVAAASRSVERLNEKITEHKENFLAIGMDITSEEDSLRAVELAKQKFGRIDVLMNNAGYAQKGPFEENSDKVIRQEYDVNLFGLMNVTRAVLPIMRQQRSGVIFNISSIGGMMGGTLSSIYSSSKHAINGFSECLRMELKPFGIKVVTVMPGAMRTNFYELSSVKRHDIQLNIPEYDSQTVPHYKHCDEVSLNQMGSPELCGKVLYDLSLIEDPPLNFFLGADAVKMAKTKLAQIERDIEMYEKMMSSTTYPE